jgi:predicted glycosyltransferase
MARESEKLTSGVKIWIDLDNTPHVPFFIPIIRELERRGHEVCITARDAFQVCELAKKNNLPFVQIGRHYGKKMLLKLWGLLWRSAQLAPFYFRQRPGLALSHGSRSQSLLCNLLRIPNIQIFDYEHSKSIPFSYAKWVIAPDALVGAHLHTKLDHARFYRGIKEDVYAPEFKPDPRLLEELGLPQDEILITIRPPADEAHYRNPESDQLMMALMSRIRQTPGVRGILLPRSRLQESAYKALHPEWFADHKIIVPSRVVDGLNILWFSDLVISGGGTMNREACALGIPVYSIFRGKTGAVDLMLENEGRLILIHSVEEIWSKIQFVRRDKKMLPDKRRRAALEDILNFIEEIILKERIPARIRPEADSRKP